MTSRVRLLVGNVDNDPKANRVQTTACVSENDLYTMEAWHVHDGLRFLHCVLGTTYIDVNSEADCAVEVVVVPQFKGHDPRTVAV